MNDLEKTKQTVPAIDENKYLSKPVGNKLKNIIIDHSFFDYIDEVMAKSFINNAEKGTLNLLLQNKLNFNAEGIYELSYSLLDDLYKRMKETGADHLVFTFAEIEPDNNCLEMHPVGHGNILYAIVSLLKGEEPVTDTDHYAVLNAKQGQTLESLKISQEDQKKYYCSYKNNSHIILKNYFSIEDQNTQCIYYHIGDVKETLEKEKERCNAFKVFLCEISDVKKVISDFSSSLRIDPETYLKYFAQRERQMTLVFNSDERYYDMGSLRP